MFEKIYEGLRETKSGRLFNIEITKSTGKVLDRDYEKYVVVTYDFAGDVNAYDETSCDMFSTLDEALAYVDSIGSIVK